MCFDRNVFWRRPDYGCRSSIERNGIFAASNRTVENSTEARISNLLWHWRFAEHADRERFIATSQLAMLIEYWFPFSEIPFTRSLGAWCDSIPLLAVSDLSRNAFALAGVGYFPNELSPFELDFHYENRRGLLTSKIALRFGIAGRGGRLYSFRSTASPEKVFSQRPRDIRDWAVAVELTPH